MDKNEKQFQCSGDCLKCLAVQRQYCASQHAYNSMRMVQKMQETLDAMFDEIDELKDKIASIQDNEALVFNPNTDEDDTAQEGDGAKKIDSQKQ